MRPLALTTVSLGVLVACGGIEPRRSAPLEARRLEADFDQAWEAAIRTVTGRGFDIRAIDRSVGVIETDWFTLNPDYAATVFVTQREDRYSVCGKPRLGQVFRVKQARLVMTLHPVQRGETALRTEASFRTRRYTDAPLWASRPLGDVECASRGYLEEEVKAEIQLRAFSERLHRLRRGGN